MRALFLAAVLLTATPAAAQTQSLKDVAWLTGEWREVKGEDAVTEIWLPADSGVMPGVNRDVHHGKGSVEFMRIDEEDGRLVFTALISGQPATAFPAKTLSPDEVVFENLEHDFPKRVIYRRCGVDLCAAIEGPFTAGGPLQGNDIRMEWRFKRVR